MNSSWHGPICSADENRRTTILRSCTDSLATMSSRPPSNGSSPTMPIVNGAVVLSNASAGHSTNFVKLNRNAALRSYSCVSRPPASGAALDTLAVSARASGAASARVQRQADQARRGRTPAGRSPAFAARMRWLRSVLTKSPPARGAPSEPLRRRRPAHRPPLPAGREAAEDAARHLLRLAELRVLRSDQVLPDRRQLPAPDRPRETRVEPDVARNARRGKPVDVAAGDVPLPVRRQVDHRLQHRLVVRIVAEAGQHGIQNVVTGPAPQILADPRVAAAHPPPLGRLVHAREFRAPRLSRGAVLDRVRER